MLAQTKHILIDNTHPHELWLQGYCICNNSLVLKKLSSPFNHVPLDILPQLISELLLFVRVDFV